MLSEDLILSDNYFDMSAGEKRVKILGKASRKVEDPADWENQIKEQLADGLKLRSVYDIRMKKNVAGQKAFCLFDTGLPPNF